MRAGRIPLCCDESSIRRVLTALKSKGMGVPGLLKTLVHLPETVPDGLAFDTEGNLYISCYRPDRIYRLTPSGQLDVLAEDYEGTAIAAPTNIAFCGQNRDLFLSANLGRWHITHYDLGRRNAVELPGYLKRIGLTRLSL